MLPPKTRRPNGVAIVISVMLLALLSVLFLALFSLSQTEMRSATVYSNQLEARNLSETATSLVIGQIRDATGRVNDAWMSQPGAIRRYRQDGDFSAGYKLYSDSDMVATSEVALVADVPDPNWASLPHRYVDLNEPVVRTEASGTVEHFPILNPAAATGSDPVEGFSYDVTTLGTNGGDSPLPMPVEWLYVLEDGTTGFLDPTNSDKFTARDPSGGSIVPDNSNPIVGRVAFWADDETSKININTASEPTFWDVPRSAGLSEWDYARYQPVAKEWQRYPGHPAATSLSTVVDPGLTQQSNAAQVARKTDIYDIVPRVQQGGSESATTSYATSPIMPDEDRLYASVDELFLSAPPTPGGPPPAASAAPPRSKQLADRERLEASRFFLTANSRAPELNQFNLPRIAIWPIDAEERESYPGRNYGVWTPFDRLIKFCSTVGGEPYLFQRYDADSVRGCWEEVDRNRQIYEYLQTLAGTDVPGFGRSLSDHWGADTNQILTEVFDYVRSTNLFDDNHVDLSSPGGKTHYTWQEADAEVQSQFTNGRYLQGNGSKSAEGLNRGHGQVTPIQIGDTKGFGRFYTITEASLHFICCADGGTGQAGGVSATDSGTTYYSNYPPINPPIPPATAPPPSTPQTNPDNWNMTLEPYDYNPSNPTAMPTALAAGQKRVQMMLMFEFYSPSQGWTGIHGDFAVEVEGADQFTIDGQPLGMPQTSLTRSQHAMAGSWHERNWGGATGVRGFLKDRVVPARPPLRADSVPTWFEKRRGYELISVPVTVADDGSMDLGAVDLTVKIFSKNGTDNDTPNNNDWDPRQRSADTYVQTIELSFPAGPVPIPSLVKEGTSTKIDGSTVSAEETTPPYWWTFNKDGCTYAGTRVGYGTEQAGRLRAIDRNPGSLRYWTSNDDFLFKAGSLIRDEDVVQSILPLHGDFRLVAANRVVPDSVFLPHQDWGSKPLAHNIVTTGGAHFIRGFSNRSSGSQLAGVQYNEQKWPDFPEQASQNTGDFDNGISVTMDGAYINKPDEGNGQKLDQNRVPYFNQNWTQTNPGSTYFTPNRIIASPVQFGSLSTHVKRDVPWRTLLFRPQEDHPNHVDLNTAGTSAPDHLLLDLFWMPVVEPYAISEPFATAGKINLNYQILPFSHIQRSTGVRAVMKDVMLTAVPSGKGDEYKNIEWKSSAVQLPLENDFRLPIEMDETLKQFEDRFDNGGVFKTASEICDIHLVPDVASATGVTQPSGNAARVRSDMKSFWEDHVLTGDNSREAPYNHIYPRLTTKSNSFRVHVRSQIIRKGISSDPETFDPAKDGVVSEFRGSTLVERYLDPNEPGLPDYAEELSEIGTESLDRFYRFRVVHSKRFEP